MKPDNQIHLGYQIGTGEPVAIPLKHMAVTGQSQEAGKTTTLEALIERSGLRAVAFITKRGEGSFTVARRIQPYFRERADWVFVSSLIDATLSEKNKLLRAWLMKVCRGTQTLAEVHRNVRAARKEARGFAESIYTEIDGYLELVVPQLAELPPSTGVHLAPGLNVVDLSPYSAALQGLVIRSILEHIYEHEDGVVTVIPEAWEFLPEGRGSPVKQAAETLIRKGAGLRNYVWIDSQDMAGVWKLALRAAAVWLIGVQREANEIKRTLENIPAGVARPKASDIAALGLGQFFACWGSHVVKTYVQPRWMGDGLAEDVARGFVKLPPAPTSEPVAHDQGEVGMDTDMGMEINALEDMNRKLDALIRSQAVLHRLSDLLDEVLKHFARPTAIVDADTEQHQRTDAPTGQGMPLATGETLEDKMYERFKARLLADAPAVVRLLVEQPEIHVAIERPVVEVDGKTLRGRLVRLIADGFFDEARKGHAAYLELGRIGFSTAKPNVYKELDRLAEQGVLTKESDGYLRAPGVKILRKEK